MSGNHAPINVEVQEALGEIGFEYTDNWGTDCYSKTLSNGYIMCVATADQAAPTDFDTAVDFTLYEARWKRDISHETYPTLRAFIDAYKARKVPEAPDIYLGYWVRSESSLDYSPSRDDEIDQIVFGIYYRDGGCKAEGIFRCFSEFHGDRVELELCADAFVLLGEEIMSNFWTDLGMREAPLRSDIIDCLIAAGFKDETDREEAQQ
jgi:hypothetical protein